MFHAYKHGFDASEELAVADHDRDAQFAMPCTKGTMFGQGWLALHGTRHQIGQGRL